MKITQHIKLYLNASEDFQELYSEDGFKLGISLISAGDMLAEPDNKKRLNLYKKLKINPENVFMQKQIHSKDIHITEKLSSVDNLEGDGFISSDLNNILTVTVADCIPIILFDKKNKSLGAFHSGWKGTGIAGDGLDLMIKNYDSSPEDIIAFIGPGIGLCCYEVDSERAEYFIKNWGRETVVIISEKYYIDLKKSNEILLRNKGIKDIRVFTNCTCCSESLGSFRRQGNDFTRMLVAAGNY